MLKCCFNPKVLFGLGATAVVLFLFVPSARGFLPVLLTLACPLSMLAMMGGMAKLGAKKPAPFPGLDGDARVIEGETNSELQRLRTRVAELERTSLGPSSYRAVNGVTTTSKRNSQCRID